MVQLDKLTQVTDLREIWKHEAKDFSKWLAEEENLRQLSDALGIDLVLSELESAVGSFSVDLFATEEGTGRKVVIENQMEDTDHDHLGKIITYASGKGADVIVWIVKRARDEHRQAVEWLNTKTDEDVGFFLVEIELWKIGDSLPAPRFNVVERPNDWAKAMKIVEGLSETQRTQLEFWQAFADYAFDKQEFTSSFRRRKAHAQNAYDLSLGSSDYVLSLTVNIRDSRVDVSVYINDNKELYTKLLDQREAITQFMDMPLEWREARKDCRIYASASYDFKIFNENRSKLFDWIVET